MNTSESIQYSSALGQHEKGPISHYAWLSLLRAYGVILVLGFHFFPWLMPGGFIGVDVFFVFSGFLITSLLVSECQKHGRVRLLSFYKRRFRRLFPALLAMLLLVLPLTLTIPEDFRADIARQVAAALSWTTNLYEIAEGQSYVNALLPQLFVHTWTLSIEMQYYLVWGLVLTVVLPLFISTTKTGSKTIARSRKVVAALALVLAVASFVTMQLMLEGASDPSAAYYSTLSHAFPILIGSAIGALAGFGRSRLVASFERLNHKVGILLTALSLALITAMGLFLPFENMLVYHAGLLLTSLLVGLVLLIGRGAQEELHKRPEPKVLLYIADRSYSIYLFHWPLMIVTFEWARLWFGEVQQGPNPAYLLTAVVGLVLTFVVSHLSYRFVERPFASRRVTSTASALKPAPTDTSPPTKQRSNFSRALQAVLTSIVALALAIGSGYSVAHAPHKTAIESDFQESLLEIDMHQMENSHQALLHTGRGGSTNDQGPGPGSAPDDKSEPSIETSREDAPELLVKPGTITVIGDSVTIYPAEGISELTGAVVDAEVSRAMVNGVSLVEAYQANDVLGEYVVIALATNAHADSFESAVAICDLLQPGHRLIFVTAYGDASMEELNAQLFTLPKTYPFVTIADWHGAISGQSDLLAADGYHLGGQEAIDIYVEVVVQSLEEAKNKPTS